jgi:hypothetical protein
VKDQLKADPFSESTAARYNLVAVSAVKVWLRDFSVLAGGIQAKVSALHRAHQLLDGATMPPRHQSGGLRGDARKLGAHSGAARDIATSMTA